MFYVLFQIFMRFVYNQPQNAQKKKPPHGPFVQRLLVYSLFYRMRALMAFAT